MATPKLKSPKKSCKDPNCPFHGSLSVRGRLLKGSVISAKMEKTIIVRRDYLNYIAKYKRYERRHNHVSAHNPPCLNAKEGDQVTIAECRPLSKTVSFVVVDKLGGGLVGGKS